MTQVGWMKQANASFTSLMDLAANLVIQIAKVAKTNVITTAQFKKIKNQPIIKCVPKQIYGPNSRSEGVISLTCNTNHRIVLQLTSKL